jgi:uncharacterized protein (DUF433 family)
LTGLNDSSTAFDDSSCDVAGLLAELSALVRVRKAPLFASMGSMRGGTRLHRRRYNGTVIATAPKLEYGHIMHDPEVRKNKTCIDGTRIAVVNIVMLQKQKSRPEEMLDHYVRSLTLAQVHSALAYYYDHPDEIEGYFRESEQAAAELEAERAEYLSRFLDV